MSKKIIEINREEFDRILGLLHNVEKIDNDNLFAIYTTTISAIKAIQESNLLTNFPIINPIEIIYYLVGEYVYISQVVDNETMKKKVENENFRNTMASVVADKYLSLSMFNHAERNLVSKFLPPMSSLNLYLNFILNILNQRKDKDPKTTLIKDLLEKSTSLARVTLNLLIQGYETEAFSTWRTLHECECALVLLEKYGDPLINKYLIHMQYGIVYRKNDQTNELGNKIFSDMKAEMAKRGLKSKDIKKFIEYGWLYDIPGIPEDPEFKLNFRDGLQKTAGLSSYNKRYELSSETVHVTPLLIYSAKEYLYFITLLSLYESFFRLEKVFVSLFSKYVTKEFNEKYQELRNVYYMQLVDIYNRELNNFKAWQKKNKRD